MKAGTGQSSVKERRRCRGRRGAGGEHWEKAGCGGRSFGERDGGRSSGGDIDVDVKGVDSSTRAQPH